MHLMKADCTGTHVQPPFRKILPESTRMTPSVKRAFVCSSPPECPLFPQ